MPIIELQTVINAPVDKKPVGSSPFKIPKFNVDLTPGAEDPNVPPRIGFNKKWLFSLIGACRTVLCLFLLGGWIAAVVAAKDKDKAASYSTQNGTRIAYIVFGILSWVIYTIAFFFNITNFINVNAFLRKIPIEMIFVAIDGACMAAMLGCSVACVVREFELTTLPGAYDAFMIGAFGVAAAFGLIACTILLFLVVVSLMSTKRRPRPAAN